MKSKLRSNLAVFTLLLPASVFGGEPLRPVQASLTVIGDAHSMTAYVFSLDKDGVSRCIGRCAELWPPIEAPKGELVAPYSVVVRSDGFRQLQYEGKPVYLWAKDKKAGDATGEALEGFGGKWGVVPTDRPIPASARSNRS